MVERAYHELRASAAAAAAEGAEAARSLSRLQEEHGALSKEADATRDRLEREVITQGLVTVDRMRAWIYCSLFFFSFWFH